VPGVLWKEVAEWARGDVFKSWWSERNLGWNHVMRLQAAPWWTCVGNDAPSPGRVECSEGQETMMAQASEDSGRVVAGVRMEVLGDRAWWPVVPRRGLAVFPSLDYTRYSKSLVLAWSRLWMHVEMSSRS
jgi:hypothetical protein